MNAVNQGIDASLDVQTPLLSICVPSYNRAAWLKLTLPDIARQVRESNGAAEVIVSDNGSIDDTPQIVEQAMRLGPVIYNRNPTNIGGNPNTYKCVSELSRGKYVLVLGDDDFLRVGGVARIVEAIQQNADIGYIHLNYVRFFADSAPSRQPTERDFDLLDSLGRKERKSAAIERVADLVEGNPDCFTPSYCSVFRRDHALAAYKVAKNSKSWASIETVLPHVLYIGKHLMRKPAYYIGDPLVVTSTNISWKDFEPGYHLVYMPEVYNILERGGARKGDIQKHRESLCVHLADHGTLVRMLTDKETPMREQFSLLRFCVNFRDVRTLRPMLIRTFLDHPRFENSLSARLLRFLMNLRSWVRRAREGAGG